MLIAALIGALTAVLVAGGGDFYKQLASEWRRALRRRVSDKQARARALEIVDDFESEAEEFTRALVRDVRALELVNQDYGATLEDYRACVDTLVDDMLDGQLDLVATAFIMEDAIGAEAYDDIRSEFAEKLRKRERKRAARSRAS